MTKRVLVVDDEPQIVDLCSRILTREGFTVQGTTSGQEAIAYLEADSFDLLVLDIRLPDMDGLAVLRRARELDPILTPVVVTGYVTLDNVIRALHAGARALILKPFTLRDFYAAVTEALAQQEKEQERLFLRAQLPILEIAQALMAEVDFEGMAGRLVEAVAQEMGCAEAALLLLDEKSGEFHVAGVVGLRSSTLDLRIPAGAGLAAQMLMEERPLVLGQEAAVEPSWSGLLRPDAAATVLVSLRTRKKATGVLLLTRQSGQVPFRQSELNLLAIVGGQIATVVENAHLYEAIARGKREWEGTFDAIDDGISIHDADFRIVRVNWALARRLRTTPAALIGRHCYEVIHQMTGPREGCPCVRAQSSRQAEKVTWEEPNLGGIFQVSAYPLGEKGQIRGVVHVMRDVTVAKRMEAELIQTEKLAALGRLAASLAHEINNPLQALRSGFRLLLNPRVGKEKRQQYLQVADREVERLINIVERVLGFYRPSREQPEVTDVNQVLAETLSLTDKQLEHGRVAVQRNLLPHPLPVEGVIDQLKQVFLNIILNAEQAMPDGGTLTVETGRDDRLGEAYVAFTDTGVGISEEEISLLGEPFYSTRPGGSGLGLAISYSIVERHGGHMDVRSKVGVGSTFTVFLPLHAEERGGQQGPPGDAAAEPAGA